MRSLAIISLSVLLAAASLGAHATGAQGRYGVDSHRHYQQFQHRQHYRDQHQSHRRHGHKHRRVVVAGGHGPRLDRRPRHIVRAERGYGHYTVQPRRARWYGGGGHYRGGVVHRGSFSTRFTLRF